jgi:hypothetical protein
LLGLGSSLCGRVHFNVVVIALASDQSCSDYDYPEGNELDQITWTFWVGASVTEETRGSNAQRIGGFHVYSTPFTNEKTIGMR